MSELAAAKLVEIRLYFNRSDNMFYIQTGDHSLFKITSKIATRVQEKENIEIVYVEGVKDMQIITLEAKAGKSE